LRRGEIGKAILVIGGAGYIGSHACKALAAAGFTPVTYDNLVYGHEWAVKWGPFERGDLLDRTRLDEVIAKYRPAAVMHFAAFAYVGESVESPGKYYRNNVVGSLTLLEAMRDHGVECLIFSSTCATYGVPEHIPIDEAHPQRPINPYGASKQMMERMMADVSVTHGIRYVALRYFNAAGADPAGEIGEDHDPETHLIPLIMQVAQGRRPYLSIFGDDYDTPDGTCIRDYIHVTDLADAHLLGLSHLLDGGEPKVYNLGNGQGFSVREVVDAACRVTGREIPVRIVPRRPGDPPRLVGDSARAMSELGWRPQFADLDAILRTAWAWHCAHEPH